MKKLIPIIAVIAAVLIVSGVLYWNKKPGRERSERTIGKTVVTTMMPGKSVTDPVHGKEAFLGVGPVEGVSGTPANGVVTLHVFADGTTVAGTQVNIAVPEDGFFYEAWLAKEDGKPELSLGHLTNPFGDVRHQLRFEFADDKRAYPFLLVTREPDDGNAAPGAVVARGAIKAQER